MIEFKDILKMKREDPSIDLHEFSRNKMIEELEFFDTIKKRDCQSSALKKEVVTMDAEGLNEFPGDPDLHEIETNIRYEIEIRWKDRAPHRVSRKLHEIYAAPEDLRLFVCVPQKFAGAVFLVAMSYTEGEGANVFPRELFPNELLLVSTGRCFEESEDIEIEKADRIHVFNGSRRVFTVGDFSLRRRAERIQYLSQGR